MAVRRAAWALARAAFARADEKVRTVCSLNVLALWLGLGCAGSVGPGDGHPEGEVGTNDDGVIDADRADGCCGSDATPSVDVAADVVTDVADAPTAGIQGRSHWDVIQQAPAVRTIFGAHHPLFIVATFTAYARFERTTIGPCAMVDQTGLVRDPSAGILTVSGGTGAPLVVPPIAFPSGIQYGYYGSTPRWANGEQVGYDASGDVIPSFRGSLMFPRYPSVLSPTSTSGSVVPVAVARDLVVSWSPTDAPFVFAQFFAPRLMPARFLECAFSGSLGTGSVPSAALRQLGGSDTWMRISGLAITTVWAGGLPVELRAMATGFESRIRLE